jgi:hypothetical protein
LGPPEIGRWSWLRPLGAKPTTFHPDKRRLSSLSSPNATTCLVGAYREDTAEP